MTKTQTAMAYACGFLSEIVIFAIMIFCVRRLEQFGVGQGHPGSGALATGLGVLWIVSLGCSGALVYFIAKRHFEKKNQVAAPTAEE